jgi:transcriptional antiterminator RfaH
VNACPYATVPRWYLIYTKPAGEAAAVRNLERQGYGVYFPRTTVSVGHGGRRRERPGALFPRYLFVQLRPEEQSLAPIRSTKGVASIVRFGNDYAVVPDLVVEHIRSHADPVSGLCPCARQAFTPDSSVRIVEGVFEGMDALFLHESGADRVVVLLEILGRVTPVRIPSAFVSPQAEAGRRDVEAYRGHRALG